MANTLSAAEAAYADALAAGIGLDPGVIRAWIACESGWNKTKAGHNYLNIGPGRSYPSVAQAAEAAVQLLRTSSNYVGIRAAVSKGPAAEIDAIIASPWDAGHYANGCLRNTYAGQSAGGGLAAAVAANADGASAGGIIPDLGGLLGGGDNPLDIVTGWIGDAFGLDDLIAQVLVLVVSGAFVIGALGLIALGLNRLTDRQLSDTVQDVGQVAALAAAAA